MYDCETCVLNKGTETGWYADYELVGDNPAVRTRFQICITFCLPLADPQGLHALTTSRGSQTLVIPSALTSSSTACSFWSMHTTYVTLRSLCSCNVSNQSDNLSSILSITWREFLFPYFITYHLQETPISFLSRCLLGLTGPWRWKL